MPPGPVFVRALCGLALHLLLDWGKIRPNMAFFERGPGLHVGLRMLLLWRGAPTYAIVLVP